MLLSTGQLSNCLGTDRFVADARCAHAHTQSLCYVWEVDDLLPCNPCSQEVMDIDQVAPLVKELLLKFYRRKGMKPQRILFFRDGVSEGQFKQVSK